MGLRFTDTQQPHYPPVGSFRTEPPIYSPERDCWIQTLPRYSYQADVEYHPSARLAPAPRRLESWRIGLIQNVMFEKIQIEYFDQEPYRTTWARPALDIGSESYRPFYNEPQVISQRMILAIEGIEREIQFSVPIIPVHEVFYGPSGLGTLLDPWSAEGYRVLPNQTLRISMEDQPAHAVRNMFTTALASVQRIMVMRFWIVAMGENNAPVILGASPPFTLASWMRIPSRAYRTLQPRPSWGSYSLSGSHTTIIERSDRIRQIQERSAPIRPLPFASGTPVPLLTGASANARGLAWMESNNLLPPRRR